MNQNKLNIENNVADILNYLIKRDNLNVDDVLNDMDTMKREKILEQHKEKYKVWQADDGRWKTKLLDGSKYGKLVAKSTLENLENCIVAFYNQDNEKKVITLSSICPEWIAYKRKETSDNNAKKLQWGFKHYCGGTAFAKMELSKIKTIDAKTFMLDRIKELGLNDTQYKEMKTVINGLLDYAVEKELLPLNVARNVHGISKRKCTPKTKKSVNEQIYVGNEANQIETLALAQYKKTKNTSYLAVAMNFYLGLRVGELVALKVSDLQSGYLTVEREEIKTFCTDENGELHRIGYEIVNHTKTDKGTRKIPCVKKAQEYFEMIVNANLENGLVGEFLLLNDDGTTKHDHAINNVLRRLNKKIATPQKGNHSIRKTCISKMAKSNLLTAEEIMDFAGHVDYQTTKTYYIFNDEAPETRKEAFEKALSISS